MTTFYIHLSLPLKAFFKKHRKDSGKIRHLSELSAKDPLHTSRKQMYMQVLQQLHCKCSGIFKISSIQVQCRILDAWGWCTGTTQRDGTGREEGGGFRMGNTCIPVQIHVDIWQKIHDIDIIIS